MTRRGDILSGTPRLWERNCAEAISLIGDGLGIGARVYNSANISVNDSTVTTLTFDSERFDTDTIHDTSSNTGRLTCKTAGTYLIFCNAAFALDVDGFRLLRIRLNGTTVIGNVTVPAVQTDVTILNLSTIYSLAVGDYVEAQVFHTAGAALNVTANSNYSPEFGMNRLA